MQIGMYDRVVAGKWLRTALGNWYFLQDGRVEASLVVKKTEHPAPYLHAGRFTLLGRLTDAQIFKGKRRISVII